MKIRAVVTEAGLAALASSSPALQMPEHFALALTRSRQAGCTAVSPVDPVCFLSAPAALLGVAIVVRHVPARRAATVDAIAALGGV
jgi:hypothetical protein